MKKFSLIRSMIAFFLFSEILFVIFDFFVVYPFLGLPFNMVLRGMGPAVAIMLSVFVIVGFFIRKFLKPICTLADKTVLGSRLTPEERVSFLKREAFVNRFLMLVNIIGFMVVTPIAIVATMFADGVLRWSTVRFNIVVVAVGPVLGILQKEYFSFIMRKIKEKISLQEFQLLDKPANLRKRSVAMIIAFTLSISLNFTMVILSQNEVLSGVDHIAIKLNPEFKESYTNEYREFYLAAEQSTDPVLKEKAQAFIKKVNAEYPTNNMIFAVLSFGFMAVLWFILGVWIFNLSSHLQGINARLRDIVNLEGDLSHFLVKTTDDDIGELQVLINKLILNLNGMFLSIFKIARSLIDQTRQEQSNVEELMRSNEEIQTLTQEVSKEVGQQVEVSKTTSGFIKDLVNIIEDNILKIRRQSAMIKNTSDSFAAFAMSMNSLTQSADKASDFGKRLTVSAEEGAKSITDMNSAIENIRSSGMSISDITETIYSIADEINIMAMNAAIEAAHAGDFGAGFAVVASEIRSLSENTSSQTTEIAELLNSMTKQIETLVARAKGMSQAMQGIQDAVNSTNKLVREIEQAAVENREKSSSSGDEMRQVMQITDSITQNLEDQAAGNKKLVSSVSTLEGSTVKIDEVGKHQENYFTALSDVFEHIYRYFMSMSDQLEALDDSLGNLKLVDPNMLNHEQHAEVKLKD